MFVASQELVSKFNELLRSESHFGLLVTIASEELRPLQLLTPSSPASFDANLESLLQPHIKPNEALYVILRRYESAPALVAVTYVPDTAPVRQKMLFASTRLTLVRELGSEHFRDTFFATTADDLTPAGFQRHDAHTALEAPLTEEERSLGEVRRAEQEAGMGTATRELHLSKNVVKPVAEDALQALRDLGAGDKRSLVMLVRYIIFFIFNRNRLYLSSFFPECYLTLTFFCLLPENQPRVRVDRTGSGRVYSFLDSGTRADHLTRRTALYLLSLLSRAQWQRV